MLTQGQWRQDERVLVVTMCILKTLVACGMEEAAKKVFTCEMERMWEQRRNADKW